MKITSKNRVQSAPKTENDSVDLGIFADILEDTDCPAFATSNLNREDKRVAVFVYDENEPEQAPETFLCSKPLSKIVRNALGKGYERNDLMSALLTLKVIELKDVRYIAVESVKKDRVNKKTLLASATKPTYNELAFGSKS